METIEVGIVGGGIHGVSAGYHLAAAGVPTWLFERGAPAGGPTGRSSAICRAYYTNHFLARVARESVDLIARLPELTGGRDGGFRRTGCLFLHPAEDIPALFDAVSHMNSVGTRVELLDVEALGREHPELDLAGVGMGAWEVDAGYADPVSTTDALFRRALELGLRASLHTEVVDVRAATGGGAEVTLADGTVVACRRLLIAAGPWTRHLAARLGVSLPLTAERHYCASFGWGGGPSLPYVLIDVAGEFYMKPDGSELCILGTLAPEPTVDPDSFHEGITEDEVMALAGRLLARAPGLDAATAKGGWAALYDVSPDWQPVIGEIADGVFVDAGTSGHGFKLAPGLGRYVADMVTGRGDHELEQFHPRRFEREDLLAAGFGEARILG